MADTNIQHNGDYSLDKQHPRRPSQTLGGRLPLADPATLTSAQRGLFEALKATWEAYANELGV
jgi:hypothetical protein